MNRRQLLAASASCAGLAVMPAPLVAAASNRTFLDIRGNPIVKDGEPIRLRGVNLGNWMILESYMMGLPSVEYHMRSTMRALLGEERFHAFFDTFMDASVRDSDIVFLNPQHESI
jgi:endoglucanase